MLSVPIILIRALVVVESNGNTHATGAHGELGALQISLIVLADVKRISGIQFSESDCFDFDKSVEVLQIYLAHYCTEKRLGRPPTLRDLALTWHRGPRGPWKDDTDGYWVKVVAAMHQFRPDGTRLEIPNRKVGTSVTATRAVLQGPD
jgi:hypothetical protein